MNKDIRSLARRAGLAAAAVGVAMTALAGTAAADATDDYPIPKRIWQTPCDAEQVLQGVRDTSPVYYERYMIDKSNRPADVQQAAVDRINWFFNTLPDGLRGNTSRNTTSLGTLKRASRSRQCSTSASAEAAASGRSTT